MPALCDSKVTFVSVSQFWGLALCCPFQYVSGPFVTLHLIISLGRRKKRKKRRGRKRDDPKENGVGGIGNKKPPADFKPVQWVLLVFLDATGRGGWASLFSLPLILRGWGPGLGHTIHSFPASGPGLPWAAKLKSATQLQLGPTPPFSRYRLAPQFLWCQRPQSQLTCTASVCLPVHLYFPQWLPAPRSFLVLGCPPCSGRGGSWCSNSPPCLL